MHGKAGTERLNTALSKHGVFSGCLGIWALRCVFNKKLHRTGFVPFPLLMSTRGILPEEGLLNEPYPAGMHSIWKSRKWQREMQIKAWLSALFCLFVHTEVTCGGISCFVPKQQFKGIKNISSLIYYFSSILGLLVCFPFSFSYMFLLFLETQISSTWKPSKPKRLMAGKDNPK